jgi:methionine sulfoxide reductase catalytic subunit
LLIKSNKDWEIFNRITPEKTYLNRRSILKKMGFAALSSNLLIQAAQAASNKINRERLYPVEENNNYFVEEQDIKGGLRNLTDEYKVTNYNNFYEFGTTKNIKRSANKLLTSPWTISFKGLLDKEFEIDIDDLIKQVNLEERIYKLRCVEAWSMVVPWSGFALKDLLKIVQPKAEAKYLVMKTIFDPDKISSQRQDWFPWPYTEVLTIDEASNGLSFIATGVYEKPLPNQNGSPLRLVVPWKYGFKSIKSIVSFEFVSKRPKTFWEEIQPKEYGFWANVNPEVAHPRWSQARDKDIGTNKMYDTKLYNGYEKWVAYLYEDMKKSADLYR